MSNQVNEKNEHVNFKIPIYQSLTKDIMIAGIPLTFALLLFAGMFFSMMISHNMIFFLIFLVIYFLLFLIIKLSKKFDSKILDILARVSLKPYIDY